MANGHAIVPAAPIPESERVARVRALRQVIDGAFTAISRTLVELHKLDCAAFIHYEDNGKEGGSLSLVAPLDRTVDPTNLHDAPEAVQ